VCTNKKLIRDVSKKKNPTINPDKIYVWEDIASKFPDSNK
jgi:hypothetical protein